MSITGTVKCEHCEWTRTHNGVNAIELAKFLRDSLLKHVEEKHPGKEVKK